MRGRAPRGQRLHAKVPCGHWQTLTFIGALRADRIDAPCVLDQPVNRRSFLQYVHQFLVPTLSKGDLVLMDNLDSHKNPEVRRAIRTIGAKLWLLLAYNPDLNPIEHVFAKMKELLRKAPERTFGDVCGRVDKLSTSSLPRSAQTT